jgi:hypothetical protein
MMSKRKTILDTIIEDAPQDREGTNVVTEEEAEVAVASGLKEFVCIRACVWGPSVWERGLYLVNDIVIAEQCPNRHFAPVAENPLTPLREFLDDEDVLYGNDWDIDVLQREVEAAKKFKADHERFPVVGK